MDTVSKELAEGAGNWWWAQEYGGAAVEVEEKKGPGIFDFGGR